MLIFVAAAVLVVGVALLVGLLANNKERSSSEVQGPVVLGFTGTTDLFTEAEADMLPAGAASSGRVEPSKAEWASLLPRLQELAAADPGDVNIQRKLALAYYNLGEFEQAVAIYKRLLATGEEPVLRNRLGNTLRDMGDARGAEEGYRRAIADDPTLAPPYLNLAELLWRQGRDQAALAIIDQGLAAVPEEKRECLEQARRVLQQTGG